MKASELQVGQKFRLTKDPASLWQVTAWYGSMNIVKAICLNGPVLAKIKANGYSVATPITIPVNSNVSLV